MNNGINKIRELRSDLSPYFFHFTRKKSNWDKILLDKCLVSDKGYICFTEMPLIHSVDMFEYFSNFNKPMFIPFGIGIKREVLLKKFGIAPVIYVKNNEKELIDSSLYWKTEIINDSYDYQWQREWRMKGNLNLSLIDDILLIIPSENTIPQQFVSNDPEIIESNEFKSVFPNYEGFLYNNSPYKIIALENISTFSNDYQIESNLGDHIHRQYNL